MPGNLDQGEKMIFSGQLTLVLCCCFYIAWWFTVFKPGEPHNWTAGKAGILLVALSISGIAGLLMTIHGNIMTEVFQYLVRNGHLMVAGVLLYIALGVLTEVVMDRPVTTELVLIAGWTVLELITVNEIYGTGLFRKEVAIFFLIVVLAAFAVNMVLYVLYYKVDEQLAYRLGALPLGIDGLVMLAISIKMIF